MLVFAVWMGAVVVAFMVISKVISGNVFPGKWVHVAREPHDFHRGPHKPALAGRSP
jgi:lipocalin